MDFSCFIAVVRKFDKILSVHKTNVSDKFLFNFWGKTLAGWTLQKKKTWNLVENFHFVNGTTQAVFWDCLEFVLVVLVERYWYLKGVCNQLFARALISCAGSKLQNVYLYEFLSVRYVVVKQCWTSEEKKEKIWSDFQLVLDTKPKQWPERLQKVLELSEEKEDSLDD